MCQKYDKHWENKENSEVLWERSEYYLYATALHFYESVTPGRIRARAVIDHRFTSGLHHAFDKKNSKYQVRIQTHENNKAVKESILKGVFSLLFIFLVLYRLFIKFSAASRASLTSGFSSSVEDPVLDDDISFPDKRAAIRSASSSGE